MLVSTATVNDICARVRARLNMFLPLPLVNRADENISLLIYGGLERLALALKDSAQRHLVMTTVDASSVSGVVDLTASVFNNVYPDTIKDDGAVTLQSESAAVFKHVSSMARLRAKTPTDTTYVQYHLRNRSSVVFKNPADGALNTYAQALRFNVAYLPVIGDSTRPLYNEVENQLIDRIAETIGGQLGGMDFLKMDEEMAKRVVSGVNG